MNEQQLKDLKDLASLEERLNISSTMKDQLRFAELLEKYRGLTPPEAARYIVEVIKEKGRKYRNAFKTKKGDSK